jgi:hypothetical protein
MFKKKRIDDYIPAYKQDRKDHKNKLKNKIPKKIIAAEPKSEMPVAAAQPKSDRPVAASDIPVAAASEPKSETPVAAETLLSDFEQDMMLLLADDSDF